jgi:hypothetical protein
MKTIRKAKKKLALPYGRASQFLGYRNPNIRASLLLAFLLVCANSLMKLFTELKGNDLIILPTRVEVV